MDENYLYSDITDKIIKAFYNVYNKLGCVFLEKVYEHAMMIELPKHGLNCTNQVPIKVFYDSKNVGDYFADIVVNDIVIVELKAAEALCPEHEAQLINYLKLQIKKSDYCSILVKSLKQEEKYLQTSIRFIINHKDQRSINLRGICYVEI